MTNREWTWKQRQMFSELLEDTTLILCVNMSPPTDKVPGTCRNSINIYRKKKLVYRHLSKTCLIVGEDLYSFLDFLPSLFWWSNKDVCLLVCRIFFFFSEIHLGILVLRITNFFPLPLYHHDPTKTREDILNFWFCFLLHTNLYVHPNFSLNFVSSIHVISYIKYHML